MIRRWRAWWALRHGTVDRWVELVALGGAVKWK